MSPKIRAKAYAPFVTAFAIAMIVLIVFFWVTFKRIDHEVCVCACVCVLCVFASTLSRVCCLCVRARRYFLDSRLDAM